MSATVADETFQFPDMEPGATVTLKLKITPPRNAGVGAVNRAITWFNSTGGSSDVVEAVVTRVR